MTARRPDVVYRIAVGAGRLAFGALDLRLRVLGTENVPHRGPVLLASNHVSYLDFLFVGLAGRSSRRRVRFLCRHDVWRAPAVGAAMTAMRHVPVDPLAPAAAYLRARGLLRGGEAVGVFPEGGISTSYTVRAMMPGAVALARTTGAPLLPVAVWGGQRIATTGRPLDLWRGQPVDVVVGEPSYVGPGEDVARRTAELGQMLQDMTDRLQRLPRHAPPASTAVPWHPAHLGGGAPTPAEARLVERVPRAAVPALWTPTPPPSGP